MRHLFSKKSPEKTERTYLDWASAAPVSTAASDAFLKTLEVFGNPSSPHAEGRAAKECLDEARSSVARLAAVKSHEVIFTSGATESNNLGISGVIQKRYEAGTSYADMHVLYLPTMHSSALRALKEWEKRGVRTEEIQLAGFAVDLNAFENQLQPQTVLICVDAVCGETGTRFETLRMRRAIDAFAVSGPIQKPLLLVDASQLPLVEPTDRTRLGADLLVLDAQKIGGVRGIGALIAPKAGHQLASLMQGGGQEEGLRPGTEPVALAAAFAAALEQCAQTQEDFAKRAREARAALITQITSLIPDAVLNEGKRQAPHILNLSLPGFDTDYAVMLLDAAGFSVSTKSACETDSEDGSKAILAYTGEPSRAAATLRISWGPETDVRDLARFGSALIDATNFLAGN